MKATRLSMGTVTGQHIEFCTDQRKERAAQRSRAQEGLGERWVMSLHLKESFL